MKELSKTVFWPPSSKTNFMTFQGLPSKLHAQLGCRRSGGVSRLARGTRSRVPGGQAVGQPRPEPSSPALLPQLSGEGRDGDAGETWARGAVKILLRVQPPPVMRPRTGGFSPRRAHRCSLPPPPPPSAGRGLPPLFPPFPHSEQTACSSRSCSSRRETRAGSGAGRDSAARTAPPAPPALRRRAQAGAARDGPGGAASLPLLPARPGAGAEGRGAALLRGTPSPGGPGQSPARLSPPRRE